MVDGCTLDMHYAGADRGVSSRLQAMGHVIEPAASGRAKCRGCGKPIAKNELRLGERLKVRWDIGELPMRALIPSLTIQPLLENAIYHGIELLPDGGEVIVTGVHNDKNLEIEIRNPVPAVQSAHKYGNQMALANIRQRFELAYGAKAAVSVAATDDEFSVKLSFPYDEHQT